MMMSAPSKDLFIYARPLGWHEYDNNGDRVPVVIAVVDAVVGFNIFRLGEDCEYLNWLFSREDAIDWAVDKQRSEISYHELQQLERD